MKKEEFEKEMKKIKEKNVKLDKFMKYVDEQRNNLPEHEQKLTKIMSEKSSYYSPGGILGWKRPPNYVGKASAMIIPRNI